MYNYTYIRMYSTFVHTHDTKVRMCHKKLESFRRLTAPVSTYSRATSHWLTVNVLRSGHLAPTERENVQ